MNRDTSRASEREKLLAQLRGNGEGRRVRHSFLGMVVAWFIGICVVMVYNFSEVERAMELLVPWACLTGMVCLGAWLVLALPIYWIWPRYDRWWSMWRVGITGLLIGAFPGWWLVFNGEFGREVLVVMLVPGGYGLITALVARWLEESRLRQMAEELAAHMKPV
ncbi:MAG: hypothetical protein QM755_15235 [Luteolibacter sp.]